MNDFEDNFVILKPIDSGQFGVVYLCEDVETKELFALKKIQKTALLDKKTLNLLFNEISILRKIDHPSVIRLFKVFEDSESVSLMMEYVPYGNLYSRINKKKVYKEKEALVFARNLLDVLAFLHRKGIIHRDIKCENILMTSKSNDFEFKLADFGLACYADSAYKSCSGSPGYMAPEMLRGNDYNAKADVFSAGVIFHIILYGAAPFEAKSISRILEKNAKCKINFQEPAYKTASNAAVELLQNILKGDPALRPSAEQALMSPWLKFRKYSDSEATSTTIKGENYKEKYNPSFSKMVEKYARF